MNGALSYKYSSNITAKEKVALDYVFLNYDLDILLVEKVRSAYKVYTEKGTFCLKKIGRGAERARKSYHVIQHLRQNGFDNTAEIYATYDNQVFIKYKKSTYYMTYWIDGREISFKSMDDILRSTELLAKFHLYGRNIKEPRDIKIRNHYEEWENHFSEHRKDLHQFKKIIDNLVHKTEFDTAYQEHIDYFRREADKALKLLKRREYKRVSRNSEEEKCLCHDSFYYQNILMDNNQKLYLIDMESCTLNIQMSDLGKFIRRVLSKKRYSWDFDVCRRIIECYDRVKPITEDEYYVLLAMLVFPHKFWKLGKKRYLKGKSWGEEKYMRKMKRLLRLKSYKEEFMKNFVQFYRLDTEMYFD